jgi:hypothetical protein
MWSNNSIKILSIFSTACSISKYKNNLFSIYLKLIETFCRIWSQITKFRTKMTFFSLLNKWQILKYTKERQSAHKSVFNACWKLELACILFRLFFVTQFSPNKLHHLRYTTLFVFIVLIQCYFCFLCQV